MWFFVGFLAIFLSFIARNKRYRWFYILSKTYKRDISVGYRYIKLFILLRTYVLRNRTVPDIFSSLVKKHPEKVAFYFEDDVWTYSKVDEFSNQIARYFKSQGYQKGNCVALFLENRPEYPCIWLGLSKIGVVTSLINTNLVNESLLHSIKTCDAKGIIFGSNSAGAFSDVLSSIPSVLLYQFNEEINANAKILPGCVNVRMEIENESVKPLKQNFQTGIKDSLVYIYTSGTTGLPKAAVITHIRFMFMSLAVNYLGNFKQDDVVYNPLPLYHTAGGMLGIGQTFLAGLSLAIRKKFSASNYWNDCVKYNCTIAQYVGEICRYVLAASQNKPVNHNVRAVVGNGLRPQIWSEFVQKCKIQDVFEVYGATEGVSNLMNIDNTVGCVGFVPRYCRWIYPVTLIKCNEITGEPIRNKDGHCIECDINEAGLAIAKINMKKGIFSFKGYSDKEATEKKILQNVFRNGDMYFNSGDILYGDEFGSYFFKDRTGDTFRWKGENVATTEVEGLISNIVRLNDAVCYGVEIPGTEGKAGMAAIVDEDKKLDLESLTESLKKNLPVYAIPVFLRIMDEVPTTGTYKLKKIELQSEGYDVTKITDVIYVYNTKLGRYSRLTKEVYFQIINGDLSL